MGRNTTPRRSVRGTLRIAAIVAALTGAVGVAPGAADDGGGTEPSAETPIWVQVRERLELCELLAMMPSGQVATEAMRSEAERPLGTPPQRAEWRRVAALLPSYWPAAQVLHETGEGRFRCPA